MKVAGALNGLPRELRHNRARYSACNTREKGPASSKVCSSRSLILTNLPASVRVADSTAGGTARCYRHTWVTATPGYGAAVVAVAAGIVLQTAHT
jgi:hypothetical protein